ncbi:gustatory and odorant receptor 63a-like [Schistocerca gregaria]|uniref:gustatory and odorant receptor 63a-like n=1 Tax=Schistocerca gregaria TaxID=7010 RepID=UPI00211F43C1|nr:gustatory and odorant receptor 63a-like [Schistocerca gregaria]
MPAKGCMKKQIYDNPDDNKTCITMVHTVVISTTEARAKMKDKSKVNGSENEERPAFRPTSGAFLYALGCYLAVSGLAAFVAFYLITQRDYSEGSVYITAALGSLVPSFFLHPFYWFGAKKVVALLKKWVEFEETYLRTTGTQLKLRLRRPSMFFTVLVPLFAFLVVMAETFIFDIAHPSVALAYTVTISMLVNHGVVWLLQCTAICRSSLLMKNYLRSALRCRSGPLSLRAQEALWLRLSRLSTATAHALSGAHLAVTTTCGAVFLMSAYGFLITCDKPELGVICGGYGAYALCHAAYVATVFNAGYAVGVAMNDFCDEEIGDLVASDENIRNEFTSSMLTYIVVLAQFRFGANTTAVRTQLALSTPVTTTEIAPKA